MKAPLYLLQLAKDMKGLKVSISDYIQEMWVRIPASLSFYTLSWVDRGNLESRHSCPHFSKCSKRGNKNNSFPRAEIERTTVAFSVRRCALCNHGLSFFKMGKGQFNAHVVVVVGSI